MSVATKEAGSSGGSEKRWGGGGWGVVDIFTPGDPARRVSPKWRRSIELCSQRVKGGDADRDVERCASEAPNQPPLSVFVSGESTILYQSLFITGGEVKC